LVIYFIASIQTIGKSAVSEKEKKNKSEKSIRHARQKGYLKIHLNYFFIKRTENYLFLMK